MSFEAISAFVLSGRLVDIALGVVALEAIALILIHRATGKGFGIIDTLANLGSGACLMLGLRLALTQASWILIVAALSASLIVHLFDLYRRWTRL
jgi:preprotein translocase subunit SecG